jgi:hypothetical protein
MGFEVYWKADADGSRMRGRYVPFDASGDALLSVPY